TNSSPAETAIKKTAIERSVKRYLLVDHTKFEVSSLVTYAQFDKLDAIITDQYPDKELENAILSAGCEIILADS
ncbi:MAG TPA: DeoR/GlpR transcriptional regulator, partial [Mobilitalea sp.]|nr:DeoR/GlpR transcriptional regulator [Mobilitalea sp.]